MSIRLPEAKMAIPAFLDSDPNGHALKAAMEKGIQRILFDIEQAEKYLNDVDSMPEWRLDDMAWSWNMVWFDYTMPVEIKREMVRRAEEINRGIGTPGLLKSMLEAVFESVNILVGSDYGGEPYHFMVEIAGNRAGEMEKWAQRAVEIFKPLRSQFDGFIIQTTNTAPMHVAAVFEASFRLVLNGS
jgi:phage tail P2-like protein